MGLRDNNNKDIDPRRPRSLGLSRTAGTATLISATCVLFCALYLVYMNIEGGLLFNNADTWLAWILPYGIPGFICMVTGAVFIALSERIPFRIACGLLAMIFGVLGVIGSICMWALLDSAFVFAACSLMLSLCCLAIGWLTLSQLKDEGYLHKKSK